MRNAQVQPSFSLTYWGRTMLEAMCVLILLVVFWRLWAMLAALAACVVVPLAAALLTFYGTQSGLLAICAALAALFVSCGAVGELRDRLNI